MAPSKCCRVLPLTQAAAVARQTPKGSSVCSRKVQVPTVTVTNSANALYLGYVQGRIQDFQKGGGGHTLIERAISYHFSQKGCMYVRAPQVHVVIRAAPCWEQSSLVPRLLFTERENSLVNCLYRFGSNILKSLWRHVNWIVYSKTL